MTDPAHMQSKTMIQTTRKVNLTGEIPDSLRDEYLARLLSLKATEAMIIDLLGDVPELRGLTLSRAEISKEGAAIHASVSYNVPVDGIYKKSSGGMVAVDVSTMGLLLNSKVLTVEEKRAFLIARGFSA